MAGRISNKVRGVNRIVYDISGKPPPGSGKSIWRWRACGNAKRSALPKT